MRSSFALLLILSLADVCGADCLPLYAANAKAHGPNSGWLVSSGLVFGGSLVMGEPLVGAAVAAAGLSFYTLARIDRHLIIQPAIILVQARRGDGAKLNEVARSLDVDPAALAAVVRDLDARGAFCRAGLMNEAQMLQRIDSELKAFGPALLRGGA